MLFTRPLRFHTSNEVAQLSIGQIPLLVHQGGEPVLERLQIRPELNHVAPAGAVLAIILVLYGIPALAGFDLWPDFARRSTTLTNLQHNVDEMTFATGYRPIRAYIAAELRNGSFPFWLSTQGLGVPLVEEYEYQMFNPLEWMNWLGSDAWWTAVLCLELWIAAMGVYVFCWRHLVLTRAASGTGAVAYVAAGYLPWFYTVS